MLDFGTPRAGFFAVCKYNTEFHKELSGCLALVLGGVVAVDAPTERAAFLASDLALASFTNLAAALLIPVSSSGPKSLGAFPNFRTSFIISFVVIAKN
jgi:hypothetical protein